jgi:predicted esterase
MRVSRRSFALGVATSLAAGRARAETPGDGPLELRSLALEHEVLLALPPPGSRPARLVILLHGLGETGDPHMGARAWVDLYGLASAVTRLTHAPLARVSGRDDWGPRLGSLNAELSARPYRGLAFACPHVPRMGADKLDAYARWIDGALVPRVRDEAGARVEASPPLLGGCSYGGWISLEVFVRAPDRFGAWAGVQTAVGREAASWHAERLARVASARPLLVETSSLDPFHDGNVALAGALRARGAACDLEVLPGPHDQPWLREAGTPTLVAWLDRVGR